MTLRKIKIDNCVKFIPQSEQIQSVCSREREGESKPKTIKNISLPRKRNKKFPQNNKNFIKNYTGEGFGIVK